MNKPANVLIDQLKERLINRVGGFCFKAEGNKLTGHLQSYDYVQNQNDFELTIDDQSKYLDFIALYIPSKEQGSGLASKIARNIEEFAFTNNLTIRMKPGDKGGGLFWTERKYYWKYPSKQFCKDILELIDLIDNPHHLKGLSGRSALRFQHLDEQTLEELKLYRSKLNIFVLPCQNIVAGKKSMLDFFHIMDIYGIGKDKTPIFLDHKGNKIHAGKFMLRNSSGWVAYKSNFDNRSITRILNVASR